MAQGSQDRIPEIMLAVVLAVSWLAAALSLPSEDFPGWEGIFMVVLSPALGMLFGWPFAWFVSLLTRKDNGGPLLPLVFLYLVGIGASLMTAFLALRALWSFSRRGDEGFVIPFFAVFGYAFLARLRKVETRLGSNQRIFRWPGLPGGNQPEKRP